jgi:hypothetical protein
MCLVAGVLGQFYAVAQPVRTGGGGGGRHAGAQAAGLPAVRAHPPAVRLRQLAAVGVLVVALRRGRGRHARAQAAGLAAGRLGGFYVAVGGGQLGAVAEPVLAFTLETGNFH